jgi:orotidine-5'-phosphate decarboxylase
MQLALRFGVGRCVKTIRQYSGLPVIYDHQKYGTDIPEISGGAVLRILREAGVDAVIVFPHAGPRTLQATVEGCSRYGLVAIVGGEMTHSGFLVKDGGYLTDEAPARIYEDAARLGVEHFVLPATRPTNIRRYREILASLVSEPRFLFPGIGKGQGGDIVQAFDSVEPFPAYAIVGRGIYAEPDHAKAARNLWQNVAAG